MAIFFGAHVITSTVALFILKRRDHLPEGLIPLFAFAILIISSLSVLSLWRGVQTHPAPITGVMVLIVLLAAVGLHQFGRRFQWLPPRSMFERAVSRLPAPLQRMVHHV